MENVEYLFITIALRFTLTRSDSTWEDPVYGSNRTNKWLMLNSDYYMAILVLYSHEQLYIHICKQKHNDAMRTSGHSSLEKYTSHFIWKVVSERELEMEQNCNILTPTLMAITAFLSRSPEMLNRGPGGSGSLGHGPHSSIFSPTDLNSN